MRDCLKLNHHSQQLYLLFQEELIWVKLF
jgi:hypothetical protein